ncbi:MAG: ATP-binding protein [Desulfobacterota bacterium]|nr:ATP-binding protein [Thermodesulfobacteriota bacterium]
MLELALHVLDIAENSSRAEASLVEITIVEDLADDDFSLEIRDNGHGMDEQTLQRALDPFYTTKKVRRIGLGLPMLKQAALSTGGSFSLQSAPGTGTVVHAGFKHSHIDRQPLGDIAGSITALILGNPDIDFVYRHIKDGREYVMDTREIREGLGQLPLNTMAVLNLIRDNIREGLEELNG